MKTDEHSPGTADAEGSAWSPFRDTVFTVLWVATVLSNIGSWMQNAAAGWLMTSLRPQLFEVALVQAATTLPMFLFSLPARGATRHPAPPHAAIHRCQWNPGVHLATCAVETYPKC
jgi:hypothetical protein